MKKASNKKKSEQCAFILTLLLVLVALGSLLWILFHRQSPTRYFPFNNDTKEENPGRVIADIYQDGELIQSILLDNVTETYTFTITNKNGGYNEIEVRPGSIGILSADCPDKLCVHQGFISTSLLPITCLPNRLVIQIRVEEYPSEEDTTPDVVTY